MPSQQHLRLRVTKFGNAGTGFLTLGVSCTESEENAPQRDMFIVQWVWGSLFGTQCLVCLEPTLDIKWQGEFAHGWLEASLLGCYQDKHTQTTISQLQANAESVTSSGSITEKSVVLAISRSDLKIKKTFFFFYIRALMHMIEHHILAWTPITLCEQLSQLFMHLYCDLSQSGVYVYWIKPGRVKALE